MPGVAPHRWLPLGLLLPALAWAEPRLAVLDLDNLTGDASFDGAGPGVAAVLTTKLSRIEAIEVVERQRLAAVQSEIELGASGAVDAATAARAGALLGADYLVTGALFSVQLPAVAVDLRVIDSSTGQIVLARQVRGTVGDSGEEFFVLLDQLSTELLDGLDIALSARDRIRLSQVDVERLNTVSVYGEALDALAAGQQSEARSLLAQAAALEPGFALADEALASIGQENSARQTAIAHAAITEGQAALDRLQAAVDGASEPTADPVVLAQLAVKAQLHLVRGEVDAWEALDTAVADTILAEHEAMGGMEAADAFRREVRRLLDQAGSEWLRSHVFLHVEYWPFESRTQRAEIMARLGRTDDATQLLIANYQRPGPLPTEASHPPHPLGLAKRLDAWDTAVVLSRQKVLQLELVANRDELSRASRDLDQAIEKATTARQRRGEYRALLERLAAAPADTTTLREEERLLSWIDDDLGMQLSGYQQFVARVEAGVYDGVRDERDFRDVADAWRDVARSVAHHPLFFPQRVAAELTFQQHIPARDAEQEERYRERLERTIEGAWQ